MSAIALREKLPTGLPDIGELLKSVATPATDEKQAPEPPCHLVLHNDDFNSFGFVASVLGMVLGYSFLRCLYIAVRVHVEGERPIWTGARKVAEDHARRIRNQGADPQGAPGKPPFEKMPTLCAGTNAPISNA